MGKTLNFGLKTPNWDNNKFVDHSIAIGCPQSCCSVDRNCFTASAPSRSDSLSSNREKTCRAVSTARCPFAVSLTSLALTLVGSTSVRTKPAFSKATILFCADCLDTPKRLASSEILTSPSLKYAIATESLCDSIGQPCCFKDAKRLSSNHLNRSRSSRPIGFL